MRGTAACLHNQLEGEDLICWRKGDSWSDAPEEARRTGPGIRGGTGCAQEPR